MTHLPAERIRPEGETVDDVRLALNTLEAHASAARRVGLDWILVAIAHDLARCLWIGEDVPRLSQDPVENILRRCREYAVVLDFAARALPSTYRPAPDVQRRTLDASVEDRTHTLYGSLWAELTDDAVTEAADLLRIRLERNGLGRDALAGKRCLDAGCGSGRYTVALKMLGARWAVGIDLGVTGVLGGRERAARARISDVRFCVGSVLSLPFPDGAFDFVMSNGVLHHSVDPMRGLREMRRVLRPGGTAWLYLYNSDGVYWMVRKALRRIVGPIRQEVTRQVLTDMGLPPNRLFLVMDALYVPIEENYTRKEVEHMLVTVGFRNWRVLTRGGDRDLSEAVHRDPSAVDMYGRHGDLRFWLQG